MSAPAKASPSKLVPANGNLSVSYVSDKVPTVQVDKTVGFTKKLIWDHVKSYESIHYIYAVDSAHKLRGVLSLRELYHHRDDQVLKKVIKTHPLYVLPSTHQHKAAQLALKHGIKAMPVVDRIGIFLGVVPSNEISQILYHEHRKAILKYSGVSGVQSDHADALSLPVATSVRHRLPWLEIGLVGGILAASIIGFFESTLQKHIVLVAFIPLVVYISSAVSTQMQAFVLRDFAFNRHLKFKPYFTHQSLIVLILALVLGASLFGISLIMYRHLYVSMVLGVALVATTMSAISTGLILPFVLRSFKSDPADSSGPLGTMIQDLLSILMYCLVAAWLL